MVYDMRLLSCKQEYIRAIFFQNINIKSTVASMNLENIKNSNISVIYLLIIFE